MTNEAWRPVAGFAGKYEVSDLGRVRSIDRYDEQRRRAYRGQLIAQNVNNNGYPTVRLGKRGPCRTVHRIVMEAFSGIRPEGRECRHLDGNRLNNHLGNLKWGSREENVADKMLHDTQPRGERQHGAKLTDERVGQVFLLRREGLEQQAIADRMGVDPSCISRVLARKTWAHVSPPSP